MGDTEAGLGELSVSVCVGGRGSGAPILRKERRANEKGRRKKHTENIQSQTKTKQLEREVPKRIQRAWFDV